MTVEISLLEENPVSHARLVSKEDPLPETVLNQGQTWDLGPVLLAAGTVRVLDLLDLLDERGILLGSSIAALTIEHSGLPGQLFAEVVAISQDSRFVFHDPVTDSANIPVFQTSVSFDLSGGRNKVLTLRNLGTEPTLANIVLYFQASEELHQVHFVRFLPGDSLTAVDLQALRDNRAVDIYGSHLPPELTFGHVAVSSESAQVIAGDFAFDDDQSYATCFDACDGCDPALPGCFASASAALKAIAACYDEPAPAQTVIFNYIFFSQSSSSCVYQYCPGQDTLLCNFSPTGLASVLRPPDGVCRPYMREFLSFPGCATTGIYVTFTKPASCP
jgi:hypothetical protein